MPDHVHVLIHDETVRTDTDRFLKAQRLKGFLTRLTGDVWHPASPPTAIPKIQHLKRQVRYVHLNPCRESYCRDPIEWEWSTHRDYLGATAQPWPDVDKALRKLGFGPGPAALSGFHQYISSDPSVAVGGTAIPQSVLSKPSPGYLADLKTGEIAAALALRSPSRSFSAKGAARTLVMGTLSRRFQIKKTTVAQHFGISRSALSKAATNHQQEMSLAAAITILLSDGRFLHTHTATQKASTVYGG